MSDQDAMDRGKKERSPSFPFIPLRKAIERAQAMQAAHRKNPARPAVVGETWGYSPSSSGLVQTAAALKAYGLLEDVGRGGDRRIQLSDLALRILNDEREGARASAIKEAAMRPKIIGEYLETWGLERPSDSHCVSELTLDRGFTPDAAKAFLRIFDDNISFAGMSEPDKKMDISREDKMEARPEPGGASIRVPSHGRREQEHAGRVSSLEVPAATLPLPEGMVTLTLPVGLSERSVKSLKAWIDVIVDLATVHPGEKTNEET